MSGFRSQSDQEELNRNLDKRLANVCRKNKSRVVPLDNSMTAADAQAIINGLLKCIPYGETLIIQFADGTYNWTSPLYIGGFYGGGGLYIYGKASEFSAGTSKSVFLDFSGGQTSGIIIENCAVNVRVYGLKIRVQEASGIIGLHVLGSSTTCNAYYNYFLGSGVTAGTGVRYDRAAAGTVKDCYVSNLLNGISAVSNAHVYGDANNSTGTLPAYGSHVTSNAVMGHTATYPLGSTAHWVVTTPGIWRP